MKILRFGAIRILELDDKLIGLFLKLRVSKDLLPKFFANFNRVINSLFLHL